MSATRRADGFHPLQSLAVFTDLGDVLAIEAAPELVPDGRWPFRQRPGKAKATIWCCAPRARLGRRQGARLTLTKNLPVASGIGGGSADAAAALRGLNQLWNAERMTRALCEIAAGAGFGHSGLRLSSALLSWKAAARFCAPPQSMPRIPMLLVNPGVAVPTKDVFAGLQERSGVEMALPRGRFGDTADLLRFLETTRNDLEAPARGASAGDRRGAGRHSRPAGRAVRPHVGQRRHLFRHFCR